MCVSFKAQLNLRTIYKSVDINYYTKGFKEVNALILIVCLIATWVTIKQN